LGIEWPKRAKGDDSIARQRCMSGSVFGGARIPGMLVAAKTVVPQLIQASFRAVSPGILQRPIMWQQQLVARIGSYCNRDLRGNQSLLSYGCCHYAVLNASTQSYGSMVPIWRWGRLNTTASKQYGVPRRRGMNALRRTAPLPDRPGNKKVCYP
jgi:hypothetical protein